MVGPSDRVTKKLVRALGAFPGVDTVVVSDAYPPETVGGAEISLHETLKHLPGAGTFLVVKFTGDGEDIQFYRHEGIRVLELPGSSFLDAPGSGPQPDASHWWGPPARHCAAFVLTLANVWRFGLSRERWHIYMQLLWGRVPRGGILADCLPEQYRRCARWLACIVENAQPGTVLANNTRSILAVYHSRRLHRVAWSGRRTVAMVRDNRFFCARYNQLVRTGGRDCVTCDHACAAEDAGARAAPQRQLLDATRRMRQAALDSFDDIVVTSAYLKRQIEAALDAPGRPVVVANFAGDPDSIDGFVTSVREPDAEIVAVVGSINEQKGQLEFIRNSIGELDRNPKLEIQVIGRGQRGQDEIREFLDASGHGDRVTFPGFLERSELYKALAAARLVVLPTLWPEPFGRVPLEAAVCRKPVVAFRAGALEESIVDGETGCLISKGDYRALWAAINNLLTDGGLRRTIGEAARAHVLAKYPKGKTVSRMRSLLEKRSDAAQDAD